MDRPLLVPVDAGVIRRRYSRWMLWGACALLVTANVFNIGADLGGHGGGHLVAGAMGLGLVLDYAQVETVALLFWSAVQNGVLAPPLIVLVVRCG